MGAIKELNIKNQTYYYFDDMIDIRNFHSNLLKIDKRPYKDDYIYHIDYLTIKKFGDYAKINSVNPLYLIIYSATGYFKEKNGKKYLIIDSTEEYEKVFFLELNQKLKLLMMGKKSFMRKMMMELDLILMMIYL